MEIKSPHIILSLESHSRVTKATEYIHLLFHLVLYWKVHNSPRVTVTTTGLEILYQLILSYLTLT